MPFYLICRGLKNGKRYNLYSIPIIFVFDFNDKNTLRYRFFHFRHTHLITHKKNYADKKFLYFFRIDKAGPFLMLNNKEWKTRVREGRLMLAYEKKQLRDY